MRQRPRSVARSRPVTPVAPVPARAKPAQGSRAIGYRGAAVRGMLGTMVPARRRSSALAVAGLLVASGASGKDADPSTLATALGSLVPGDTLNLASGTYPTGLVLTDLNGTQSAWITISGPAPPAA